MDFDCTCGRAHKTDLPYHHINLVMIIRFLPILFLLFFATPATATSIFDRLSEVNPEVALPVILNMPIDSLMDQRAAAQHSSFSYYDDEGLLHNWSVKVSPRGKFRRFKCEHPPLKIDFARKDLLAAGLSGHDKYKLVTTCFHGPSSDRLVLKEYLAYRAYQLFTSASYRVRLLEITYRDANGGHPDRKATAFLIENTDELAEREGAKVVEVAVNLPADEYVPEAEATHALFQYLIGNTDWSNTLALNMKTLQRPDGGYLPVGYDFDFSGWVKTSYSVPRRQLGQHSVVQRVYLGFHQTDDVLSATAELFLDKQEALSTLIENSPLHRTDRRYLLRYAQQFYAVLKDLHDHNIMMIYLDLRGDESEIIPPGAMPEDFQEKPVKVTKKNIPPTP